MKKISTTSHNDNFFSNQVIKKNHLKISFELLTSRVLKAVRNAT